MFAQRMFAGTTTRMSSDCGSSSSGGALRRHFLLLQLLLVASLNQGLLLAAATAATAADAEPAQTHPVYLSEYKLREEIRATNVELLRLKAAFERQIGALYLGLKEQTAASARLAKHGHPLALALTFMGAEFADVLIKQHVIQRRMLAGLKTVYAKFLPLATLQRLLQRFPDNYAWIEHLSQVDVRPLFPGIGENNLVKFYTIVGQRAKLRAADDVISMTSDNMKRILKAAKWLLVEQKPAERALSGDELNLLARFVAALVDYYLDEVVGAAEHLKQLYQRSMDTAFELKAARAARDEQPLAELLDSVVDSEALEIQLNQEARSLDLPLTINADMVDNLERLWVPKLVLESVNEDRRVLLQRAADIRPWVALSREQEDEDVVALCSFVRRYICQHSPF